MEELHFSQRPKVWQGTSLQEEQHPNSCPPHRLDLLLTSHANSYDQTSQMLLTCWMYTQQFLHVHWPSVWDFRRLGSWWGCQASKNPRLRVKFCFFHLDRIFGWKKKIHLWSSSIKRASPTKKGSCIYKRKKCLQEGTKPPSNLISLFNEDWKIMAPSRGARSQLSTRINQIFFWYLISTLWLKNLPQMKKKNLQKPTTLFMIKQVQSS